IIAAEGELWREHRKFVAGCLKNFGMARFASPRRNKLEERILIAVEETLVKLEDRSNGVDGLDPHSILHHCIGNLLNHLVFGKVYEEDDEDWKWLQWVQEESVKDIGVAGPLNFLPFLRFLPHYAKTMSRLMEGIKKTHEIYRKILEEHKKHPKETNSVLAAYAEEMKRRRENGEPLGSFTETQCFYLLGDMYGAGVDTTLVTIWWFLLFMAAFPDEQVRVRAYCTLSC
ncbi:cytochrome P450 306a1-like, partial [Copidosoma floridanum]|uniref:cytochrome P450 306a1-like n=1 Tax=Copidosoma floridanum TaxID=29053 RepID=UPI0006C95AF9